MIIFSIYMVKETLKNEISALKIPTQNIKIFIQMIQCLIKKHLLLQLKTLRIQAWNCVKAQNDGEADIISAGNTGVLLVISRMI